MKLLASWPKRLDIDAYACIIAYADFLQYQQWQEITCLTDIGYSPTVPKQILDWEIPQLKHVSNYDWYEQIVILDTSGKEYLSQFYDFDHIIELRDHRMIGDEWFWQNLLGNQAHIELVWSCTTLIYEYIRDHGDLKRLHHNSLKLLYTGTISNTLNLQWSVTTQRDRDCCQEIRSLISIEDSWNENYFRSIDVTLKSDLFHYLSLETKYTSFAGLDMMIVQCELRDSKWLIDNSYDEILSYWEHHAKTPYRFFTFPSIQDNRNYLVCTHPIVQDILQKAIQAEFAWDRGVTQRLWLRKEILWQKI